MSLQIIAAKPTLLRAPLDSDDGVVKVKEFVDRHDELIEFSDAGEFLTIVVKDADHWECIKISGITQNADGSADLTVATTGRKLLPVSPYTGSATGFDFQINADVIVTNDPYIMSFFANLENANTWQELQTFLTHPRKSGSLLALANEEYITKAHLDTVVLGTLTTINVVVPGKAGQTVAAGQLVYFDETDNEWKLSDADVAATVENVLLGIAQGAGTDGNAIAGGVLLQGVDNHQSGLVEGDVLFASNTAGGITNSAGTKEVTVGVAKSATEIYFAPRWNQQITEDQQDALLGTSGTPSSTNKFVTDNDTSATPTPNKVARFDANGELPSAPVRVSKIAGENLAIRDAVALLEITESFATGTDERTIAFDSSNTRVSMGFQIPVAHKIVQVSVNVKKVGTPTSSLRVAIYDDNAGNPGSSLGFVDIDVNNIPSSYSDIFAVLDTPISLAANTQYHIVLSKADGTVNSSNYYMWQGSVAGGYSYGVTKTYNGSAWSTDGTRDCRFEVYYVGVKKATQTSLTLNKVLGFAIAAVTQRVSGVIQTLGELTGFTLPKYATGGEANLLTMNATDSSYRNDWSSGAKTYEQYFPINNVGILTSFEVHLFKNNAGNDLNWTLYKRDATGTYQSIDTGTLTAANQTSGTWHKIYLNKVLNGGGAFKLVLSGTGGATNYSGWNGRSSGDSYAFLDQSGSTWSIKDHGLKINGIEHRYLVGAPVFLQASGAISHKPENTYSSVIGRVIDAGTLEVNPLAPSRLIGQIRDISAQYSSSLTIGHVTVPPETRKIVIQYSWYGYSGGTSGNVHEIFTLERPGASNFAVSQGLSGTNGIGGNIDWTEDVLTLSTVGPSNANTDIYFFA